MPLLGKRILITRPGSAGKDFALKLSELGAEPILIPTIEISDPDSWHELDAAIASIDKYQWLLFASSNAVVSFAARLKINSQANSASKKMPNIAVIGDTTANTAISLGLTVSYCPDKFLAEDFVIKFPGYPNNLNNTKILWPRTNYGRDFIAKELRSVGADVHVVAAYKTGMPKNATAISDQLQSLIRAKKIDVITLASRQTAINLAKIITAPSPSRKNADNADFISRNSLSPFSNEAEAQTSLKNTLQDVLIVTIGPETSEGALNYLGRVDKEANEHSAEGIIHALKELFQ